MLDFENFAYLVQSGYHFQPKIHHKIDDDLYRVETVTKNG